MKLKDSKWCRCPDRWEALAGGHPGQRLCRAGYCTILLCPACGHVMAEFSPVPCPHKHPYRYLLYPDMDAKLHPAAKPRRHRCRRREKRSQRRARARYRSR